MINTIKLTLSFIAVILSLIWMIKDEGYEPKIVFVTMLLGFITFLMKYFESKNVFEKTEKLRRKELQNGSPPNPLEVSRIIQKYDKFYYRASKYYFDIFMVLLLVAYSYASIQNNKNIVSNYESFLNGEKVENFSKDFIYKENGEQKTLEEFRVGRNQVVLIMGIALFFFLAIFIKPSVINIISKRLRKKLEFVYSLDNFEEYSLKTNQHLQSYQFFSKAILLEVVRCFTRTTQECYLHHLAHQNITNCST